MLSVAFGACVMLTAKNATGGLAAPPSRFPCVLLRAHDQSRNLALQNGFDLVARRGHDGVDLLARGCGQRRAGGGGTAAHCAPPIMLRAWSTKARPRSLAFWMAPPSSALNTLIAQASGEQAGAAAIRY